MGLGVTHFFGVPGAAGGQLGRFTRRLCMVELSLARVPRAVQRRHGLPACPLACLLGAQLQRCCLQATSLIHAPARHLSFFLSFSSAGDFNLALLDELISEPRLKMISCCNELNAG